LLIQNMHIRIKKIDVIAMEFNYLIIIPFIKDINIY